MGSIEKIREDILRDLRERDLTDKEIESLSAETLFNEYCEWYGLIGFGHHLIGVLDHLREVKK